MLSEGRRCKCVNAHMHDHPLSLTTDGTSARCRVTSVRRRRRGSTDMRVEHAQGCTVLLCVVSTTKPTDLF